MQPTGLVYEDRVPEHLPLVVRTSPVRFLAWVGGATVAAYLAYCGLLASVVLLVARDTADGTVAAAAGGLLVILGFLLGVPALVMQRRYLGRGPLLAAGTGGVCARPAGGRAPAVWLPWTRVEAIYVKRRWYGEVLHVITIESRENLTVPVRIADRAADEILTALRVLSVSQ